MPVKDKTRLAALLAMRNAGVSRLYKAADGMPLHLHETISYAQRIANKKAGPLPAGLSFRIYTVISWKCGTNVLRL
jgi:hypothetical protein